MNQGMQNSFNGMLSSVDWDDPMSVGKYYIALSEIEEELKAKMKKAKKILVDNGQTLFYPGSKQKIRLVEGKDQTTVNPAGVVSYLFDRGRINDISKTATFSQTKLHNLYDGEIIIAKYKETTGTSSSTIQVAKMSKEDLKEYNI